jgi:hypothetical protein
MNAPLNQVAWHVNSAKDFAPVSKVLTEYAIPHEVSLARSLVPAHSAVMVASRNLRKAITVIDRNFGRRSGLEIEIY